MIINLSKQDLLEFQDNDRTGARSVTELDVYQRLESLEASRLRGEAESKLPGTPEETLPRSPFAVLAALDQAFVMQLPDAPGYLNVGGVRNQSETPLGQMGFSVTGVGETVLAALARTAGECAELSALFSPDERMLSRMLRNTAADHSEHNRILFRGRHGFDGDETTESWLPARRLTDNTEALVPATLCIKLPGQTENRPSPVPITEGCGAAFVKEWALKHGLFELIERDAYCQWWFAARPARQLVFPQSGLGSFRNFRERIRGEDCSREDVILDITTDLGIPCVAAVSFAQDGSQIACGTAANSDRTIAIEAAFREMCQLEFGYHVAEFRRRSHGFAALDRHDQAKLRQADIFNAKELPMVNPEHVDEVDGWFETEPDCPSLAELVRRLDCKGIQVYAVELESTYANWQIVKVLSPDLQPGNTNTRTKRFDKTIAEYGGTSRFTHDLTLL